MALAYDGRSGVPSDGGKIAVLFGGPRDGEREPLLSWCRTLRIPYMVRVDDGSRVVDHRPGAIVEQGAYCRTDEEADERIVFRWRCYLPNVAPPVTPE
jgi:hypothetical protein